MRGYLMAMKTLFSTLVLVMLAIPIGVANHPQQFGTRTVVFEHAGGNEWWAEVWFTGDSGGGLWVRHEAGGSWHSMQAIGTRDGEPGSPGKYVPREAFHIPPGARVQFQASGDPAANSCWFTHPQGVEQCDPGSTVPFRAQFTNPSGNEWWQQVYVSGSKPIDVVYVTRFQDTGPITNHLEKRSWGAWAASYHAPSGTIVQFTAQSASESSRSQCYRWPDAVVVTCPTFNADATTFDHKGGNEWWVEVKVTPVKPTRVYARDEGGEWKELTLRSWGNWAGSFHIEPGHKVQFRALVMDSPKYSCWFTHPGGVTETGASTCPHDPSLIPRGGDP